MYYSNALFNQKHYLFLIHTNFDSGAYLMDKSEYENFKTSIQVTGSSHKAYDRANTNNEVMNKSLDDNNNYNNSLNNNSNPVGAVQAQQITGSKLSRTRPSRLEDIKYTFSPDEELTDITDEMLNRAANPKKIGIFSSGGLSNKIIERIREDYSRSFDNFSFDTFFETFDHSIVPIGSNTEDDIPTDAIKINVETAQDGLDRDPGSDLNVRAQISLEPTKEHSLELATKTDEDMYPTSKEVFESEEPDDEYIFEPDSGSEMNFYDEPETDANSGTYQNIVSEEPKSNSELETPKDTDNDLDHHKPLSFRERAHHIFQELKRKLGLVKTPQDELEKEPETKVKPIQDTTFKPEIPITAKDELELAAIKSSPPVSEPPRISKEEGKNLMKVLEDKDILFVFTCLDDEYDIENSLVMAELAKQKNILTIVIASLPRFFGKVENVYATNKILQRLRLIAEIVILAPYFEAIEFELIPTLIHEMLDVIVTPGLINVDVADLKIVVKGGNVGVVTFGSGKHATRHKDALFEALDSKLLNVELAGVKKALLNVTGSQNITLAEVEGLADQIKNRIAPEARFILGTTIDNNLVDSLKIFLLLGVTPMEVMVNIYASE